MDPSVHDDARADPGADLDEHEVLDAAAATGGQLTKRHHVHVVVEPHGHTAAGEPLAHVVPVPAGHDRRRDRERGLEFDRARDADPDPPEAPRQGAGLSLAFVEELLDAGEHRVRTGRDVGSLRSMDEDLAREIGECDVHARCAEVRDEQVAGVGAEAEQPGRASSRRRPEPVLGEEAVVEERSTRCVTTDRPSPVASTRRARDDSPCVRTWSRTATSPSGGTWTSVEASVVDFWGFGLRVATSAVIVGHICLQRQDFA